ncbi:MAG TPA: hypothetical protein VFE33_04425 [Thermoanaerobaculia bacterium]|nr:hypothetical protein [Thermoanaerobaculia bacterium]
MTDLKKSPPELFAQILEGNLRGIGPSRKLYGHFAEAVRVRLAAVARRESDLQGGQWAIAEGRVEQRAGRGEA